MAKTTTEKQPAKLTHRYFCPACTGRAFYSVGNPEFNQRVCQKCGHTVYYDPNNYFVLSPEESDSVNNPTSSWY